MTRKRFSIITPTLNPGAKLEATINSVLCQKEGLFEYLVIDGGSHNDSLDLLRQFDGQITWVSEGDRGVYDAFNKGIDLSTGDYLYFLGAGDHLRSGILETMDRLIPKRSRVFIYGNAYLLEEKRDYAGKFDKVKLTRMNICHQAIFYERTIFEAVGKFDLRYRVFADHALNIKCFRDKRIQKLYVDEVIADYEGDGLSKHLDDPNFVNDLPQLINELLGPRHRLANALRNLRDRLSNPDR
jgi:glycosyltransferase involved in cell wall biosynthesis